MRFGAARTPAAAAAWNSTGSASAGRPIELMRRSWAAKPARMSGASTATTSWRSVSPAAVEIGADARLLLAAHRGDRDRDPAPAGQRAAW